MGIIIMCVMGVMVYGCFYSDSLSMLAEYYTRDSGKFTQVLDGWMCSLCETVVKCKKNLNRHFVDLHLEADYEFTCPECHSVHQSKDGLRQHLKAMHNRTTAIPRQELDQYMILKTVADL